MGAESFPSLFALSMAIIDSRENPWMHWKYRDANGRVSAISALRKIPPEFDETKQLKTEKSPAKASSVKISRKNARR
jgi:hypothetical protein